MATDRLDAINRAMYTNPKVVEYYSRPCSDLFPAEKVILKELLPDILNRKLLDIGIGGGRTTAFLLKISADYTGIDYSAPMIEAARIRFKTDQLYHCDVRDLSRFPAESFDFAMCSFNGLDNMSHEDRLQSLREISRVLKRAAIFVFSSHNREWVGVDKPPWRTPNRHLTRSFVKECMWSILMRPFHWSRKRFEVNGRDYAIFNDTNRYSALTYHMTIDKQIEQLRECGFSAVRAYSTDGCVVREDHQSPWIYYSARRTSCKA